MSGPAREGAVERLASVFLSGSIVAGVQVSTRTPSAACDTAAGSRHDGTKLQASDLHWGYCLARPLVTVGMTLMLEEAGLSIDTPLADIVGSGVLPRITFGDVACHNASLASPTFLDWKLATVEARERLDLDLDPGKGAAYSTIGQAQVYRMIHRSLAPTSPSLERWMLERLLVPLGLEEDLVLDVGRQSTGSRVQANGEWDPQYGGIVPMLSEQLERQQATEVGIEGGFLSTARGLADFAWYVLSASRGEVREGLPSPRTIRQLLAARRERTWDAVLRKECEFRGGFMAGLGDFAVSSVASDLAVGHAGGLSSSCFYFDPIQDLVVSIMMNTLADPGESRLKRMHFADSIARAVVRSGPLPG